ncbi:MAG: PEP-CTERM sorting domain-containing protein [Kiritimatiellales bacterium]|nr:PEP-CTERM sorting domain-containing protein [Kiritimatiellales bacterium]MCF7864278.1 PEP-CTERM sorting domain-containing protein [Kiritimatiellales bacterium]
MKYMKKMKYMMLGILASAAVSALGVTIQKDVDYSTTVVLENFSGTGDPSTSMGGTTFGSITGGAATYNYASNAGPEGYITYSPTATPFNPARYKSMRIRMAVNRDDAATTGVQVYPTPIGSAGIVNKTVTSGTTLKETFFDLSTTTANGNGTRIDPFNYTNDGTADNFQIDYIMADLGRTIGFEFDHDGDLNQTAQVNLSNVTVQNGFLSGGTTANGDAQINLVGGGAPTIDAGIYKYVEIRLKGDPGDKIDLFWNTAATGSPTPAKVAVESVENSDGNYHTYLLDFSDEAKWTGNLTSLRLDPVNTLNATFELDYVRFMETIPEPATLGLLASIGGFVLFIRRRLMM